MAATMSEKDSALKSSTPTDQPIHDDALNSDEVSLQKGDLLDLESVDPVLNAKMHLVNNAIDEIGFTP